MTDATRFEYNEEVFDALPPDKRRIAIRAMADHAGGVQRNPLWRFDPLDPRGCGVPHMPQHRWLSSWKTPEGKLTKFRLMPGGNRGGKTTTGDVANILDCIDWEAVPPHLTRYKRFTPPFHMFLVTPSDRATRNIHLPLLRQWCPKDQLVGNSVDKAFNKEYGTLTFKNGSTIQAMTQRMETEVFQGVPLHAVHFDEEPLYDSGMAIFTECMQRLVDYNGEVRMTFTPLKGMTWVYDRLWLPWASQQPDPEAATEGFSTIDWGGYDFPVYCHVVDQDDNPVIDPEGQAAAMAMAANDEERRARKTGRFVSFAGKIYSDFTRTRHVVPDDVALSRVPGAQAIIGGLDPGYREQAGIVFVCLDDDGVWVLGEVAESKTVISQVARSAELAREGLGLRPLIYIADPAIVRVDHQTGKSDQTAYLEAGVRTRGGNNAVPSGIKAIQQLLDRDRLHIAASCEVLIEQFNRYRWKTAGRSEDAPPARPVKRDDHCLGPGTLVETARGAVPIEDVAVGDEVFTRAGLKPVLSSGVTGLDEEVWELALEDGRGLVGTGAHPVWVEGRGMVALDAIRYGDILLTCPDLSPPHSAASPIAATLTRASAATGSTSTPPQRSSRRAGHARSIALFGNTTTAPSPTAGTSTTATATRSTTTPATSSASPRATTPRPTGHPNAQTTPPPMPTASATSRPSGTAPPRGGRGTPSTLGTPTQSAHPRPACATSVAPASSASASATGIASAPTPASPRRGALPVSTTSIVSASSAAPGSASTDTERLALVPVRAVGKRRVGRSLVYNLTVADQHEFLAQGILVSNCLDALRYAVMSLPIPEVAAEPDTRTSLQRAVDADIERAMTSAQSGPAVSTIGAGQFD